VPGLSDLGARRAKFQALIREIKSGLPTTRKTETLVRYDVGKGMFLSSSDLESLLSSGKVQREALTDNGLEFIRRRDGNGWIYFVVNLGQKGVDQWLDLSALQKAQSAIGFDAMTGKTGILPIRKHNGKTQVYLQLKVGESLLIRASPDRVDAPNFGTFDVSPAHLPLNGPWRVEFIEGGPDLPPVREIEELSDWTTWMQDNQALRAFSGTARYSLHFARPAAKADSWEIQLGEVCHSADVKLNGHDLGKVISRPWRVRFDASLLQENNTLEIEVTNLMASRLADLDRRKVDWHPFFFVDINYKPFDASRWEPVPSGLIGPVRLVPLQQKVVEE
jgi:hypothetical protein